MYFKEYLKKSLCQKIRQIAMVFRNLTEKMRKSLAEKNRQNTMVMPQFDTEGTSVCWNVK